MKALIITLHRYANCGSALQAFALWRFLQDRGIDSELIDYCPHYMETEGRRFRSFVRKTLFLIPYLQRQKKFAQFIDRNCSITPIRYKTYHQLVLNPPKGDVYISGSDQLWNPSFECGRDDAFFLEFIHGVPKISYATSLGSDSLTEGQIKNIAQKISDYEFVSVREECSSKQLALAGVKDVKWVCDPTFLLERSHYDFLAKNYQQLGRFVAVYLVEKSPLLDWILESLSQKDNLKIVGVGGYLKKYKCDKHYMDAGPSEFLGLIRDSQFVVATSFHATVFSLIFHKNFLIIPPKINVARIEQLLGYLGLENKIVRKKEDFEAALKPINYSEVDSKLNLLIINSKKSLLDALAKAGGKKNG